MPAKRDGVRPMATLVGYGAVFIYPYGLQGHMVFVKALKALALSHAILPLAGCAIGLGVIFNGFLRGVAYSPDLEDALFSHTMLGFALVESFMVIALVIVGVIFAF